MAVDDLRPLDSGTENRQGTQPPAQSAGELMPRPQLSVVAGNVTREAAGLVQYDPTVLSNIATHRLLVAQMHEQETRISELRRDLAEGAERERNLRNDHGALREKLARAQQALADEHKLKLPRALILGIGGLLLPVGGEQVAAEHYGVGITLLVLGLLSIFAGGWLGSKEQP